MSFSVTVKWGKEKYEVDANTEESPMLFKAQLFALTGVQPERQKIMFKGKTLGNEKWDNFDLKEGAILMMMGSADTVPVAPKEKAVFLEDLTDAQRNRALALPAGLKNLGNTCYMNATLQCLKTVPELRDALRQFRSPVLENNQDFNPPQAITAAVRDLFLLMDGNRSQQAEPEVVPLVMVQVLHMAIPRFAEKGEGGGFVQQDANECWVELVRMMQQKLQPTSTAAGRNVTSLVNQYFGGKFAVTMRCKEAPEEPVTHSVEDFLQLSCFLTQEVKYLQSGLKAKLIEEVKKHSVSLNRDATYERTMLIDRLPAYLTIQLMRFYYKGVQNVNAKILKDVKFTLKLDMFDLCTPELRQKLLVQRNQFKEQEDREMERLKAIKTGDMPALPTSAQETKLKQPYSFADDPGSNNSGFYELQAVLTHKGRASNSGHYVAWIKRGENDWLMCDDENVNPVTDEEVLKLSGGGDWHCAYVLLYGPRVLELHKGEEPQSKSEAHSTTA